MLKINDVFSCGICTSPYTVEEKHKPISFDCGHGSCQSCLNELIIHQPHDLGNADCPNCRGQITKPVPNWVLIDQMHSAALAMAQQAAVHQKLKNKLISNAANKFLRDQTPENLEKKANKLVDLGLFTTPREAAIAIEDAAKSKYAIQIYQGFDVQTKVQEWQASLPPQIDKLQVFEEERVGSDLEIDDDYIPPGWESSEEEEIQEGEFVELFQQFQQEPEQELREVERDENEIDADELQDILLQRIQTRLEELDVVYGESIATGTTTREQIISYIRSCLIHPNLDTVFPNIDRYIAGYTDQFIERMKGEYIEESYDSEDDNFNYIAQIPSLQAQEEIELSLGCMIHNFLEVQSADFKRETGWGYTLTDKLVRLIVQRFDDEDCTKEIVYPIIAKFIAKCEQEFPLQENSDIVIVPGSRPVVLMLEALPAAVQQRVGRGLSRDDLMAYLRNHLTLTNESLASALVDEYIRRNHINNQI